MAKIWRANLGVTETALFLDGPWAFAPNSPPNRDISVAAYANQVYVAWTRPDGAPQGSKVRVAKSTDNGASFTQWAPSDEGGSFRYYEPELSVTDQAVHLARVRYSDSTPKRVQLLRLSPLPEILTHITSDTEMTKGAEWPSVAPIGSSVLVALQRCTGCSNPATVHVYSASCTNDLMACTPLTLVSDGAATPSGAPVLASFDRHVHIAWQANAEVVYQRLQAGPLFTWDPVTRLYDPVLGGTFADSRYIYGFSTLSFEFSLKFVDLPACKSYGSAVWHVPAGGSGRMYYFAGFKTSSSPTGCEAGGNQVVRYDPDPH